MKKPREAFSERMRAVKQRDGNFWRDLEDAKRLVESRKPKPGVLIA